MEPGVPRRARRASPCRIIGCGMIAGRAPRSSEEPGRTADLLERPPAGSSRREPDYPRESLSPAAALTTVNLAPFAAPPFRAARARKGGSSAYAAYLGTVRRGRAVPTAADRLRPAPRSAFRSSAVRLASPRIHLREKDCARCAAVARVVRKRGAPEGARFSGVSTSPRSRDRSVPPSPRAPPHTSAPPRC